MRKQSALWNHFDKNPQKLIAICRYCSNSLSYKSTIANLKEHLRRKHKTAYDELVMNKPNSETASHPTRIDPIWNYYDKHSYNKALCRICSSEVYEGSLDRHLKVTHPGEHDTYVKVVKNLENKERENEAEASHPTRIDPIWNYYDKHSYNKALCRICSSEVYEGSLDRHLKVTHPGEHDTYVKVVKNLENEAKVSHPTRDDQIWNYYEKHTDATALCGFCSSEVSFSSLYRHLKVTHPGTHETLMKLQNHPENELEGEDTEEHSLLSAVRNYFEQGNDLRVSCSVCKVYVDNDNDELKSHLQESHPELLEQIMLKNDDNDKDEESNADENEIYTEVVYLDEDVQQETSKLKDTVKSVEKNKFATKTPKVHETIEVEEIPIKKKKEDTDELEAFLQYISILLKKLPHDVFSKVQIVIINTILKANYSASQSRIRIPSDDIYNIEFVNNGPNIISLGEGPPVTGPGAYTLLTTDQ